MLLASTHMTAALNRIANEPTPTHPLELAQYHHSYSFLNFLRHVLAPKIMKLKFEVNIFCSICIVKPDLIIALSIYALHPTL